MNKTYSKKRIIELSGSIYTISENVDVAHEERRLETWLKNILVFLRSNRAQTVLQWHKNRNLGVFLLERRSDLGKSTGEIEVETPDEKTESVQRRVDERSPKLHRFNLITSIFLALLVRTYEERYFQMLMKNKQVSIEDGDKWIEKLDEEIDYFKDAWETESAEGSIEWDILKINLMTELHKLTHPEINKVLIDEMDSKVNDVMMKFSALPEDAKAKAYGMIINRISYIENKIDVVISQMNDIEHHLFIAKRNRH